MGGAAGHMSHPFDLGWVDTGSDLIDFFDRAKTFLEKKGAGAVKIDGVNVSFKVVGDDENKQFAVDRGSLEPIDIDGITTDRVDERFPEGHGMRPAIRTLLTILNAALPSIRDELQKLGMWDNPTMFLNTEYVAGTTNVTEYDENFLAIHGLNQFYEVWKLLPAEYVPGTKRGKKVKGKVVWKDKPDLIRPGFTRPEGVKAPSVEVPYDPSVMESLIKKLNPTANKYGFQVYGSVPTERIVDSDIDFSSTLSEPFTVRVADDREITKSLGEWLSEASNPRYKTVKLKNGKKTHPLHKELYKAILDGSVPIVDLIEDTDAEAAIYGAIIMHATRMLGNDVLRGLTSPMGDVMSHEGVVMRDEKLFGPNPVKITGEFILGGMGSGFQTDTSLTEEEAEEPYVDIELIDDENADPVVDSDFGEQTVAIVPGAFKPPHLGHLQMVEKYLADGADRVIILVSQPTLSSRPIPGVRDEGLSPEDSIKIWEMLTGHLGPEVEIEKSPLATPISAAYALVMEEPDRTEAAKKAGIKPIRRGDTIILGCSEKDCDWKRWTAAEKYVADDLKLMPPAQSAVTPSIHSAQYMGLLNVSPLKEDMPSVKAGKNPGEFHASDMRYLLEKASEDEEAVELLEDFVGEAKVFDLLSILGLDTGLNELTSMAVGAVAGPGAKKPAKRDDKDKSNIVRRENIDLSIVDGVIRLITERGIMK